MKSEKHEEGEVRISQQKELRWSVQSPCIWAENSSQNNSEGGKMTEREREREGGREGERGRETERNRERQRETEKERA